MENLLFALNVVERLEFWSTTFEDDGHGLGFSVNLVGRLKLLGALHEGDAAIFLIGSFTE